MKTNLVVALMVIIASMFIFDNAFAAETSYKIVWGDTLIKIAKKHYGKEMWHKYTSIAKRNSIKKPYRIFAGKSIVIPNFPVAENVQLKEATVVEQSPKPSDDSASTSLVPVVAEAVVIAACKQLLEKVEEIDKKVSRIEARMENIALAQLPSVSHVDAPVEVTDKAPDKTPDEAIDEVPDGATDETADEVTEISVGKTENVVIEKVEEELFLDVLWEKEIAPDSIATPEEPQKEAKEELILNVSQEKENTHDPIVTTEEPQKEVSEKKAEYLNDFFPQRGYQIITLFNVNTTPPEEITAIEYDGSGSDLSPTEEIGKEEVKSKEVDKEKIKKFTERVDTELAYSYGCLDFMSKCQEFRGELDIYGFPELKSGFGLNVGASATFANLEDMDSQLDRKRYAGLVGLVYKNESDKKRFVTKNGLMYRYTEDKTLSASLSEVAPQLVLEGFDTTTLKVSLERTQQTVSYYNKTDFTYKGEEWKINVGSEIRIPFFRKTETLSGQYLASYDESLAALNLGIQKKMDDDLFLGVNLIPVSYSSETEMFGAKASLAIDWGKLSLEGGVLFHPYGLSNEAEKYGGTFDNTWNAFFLIGVELQ